MRTKKIAIVVAVITAPIIGLQGCYKVATVIPDNKVEVTEPVSFAKDIIPIFNTKCNMSGCHNQGGQIPNLSVTVSYNSLLNGNYIDKSSPANSLLYLKMSGKKGSPMPLTGSNIEYNALVLAWIQQGAKDN